MELKSTNVSFSFVLTLNGSATFGRVAASRSWHGGQLHGPGGGAQGSSAAGAGADGWGVPAWPAVPSVASRLW